MTIYDNPQYQQRWAMYQSALSAGIPIVSRETCAVICAMLLVWGNTEEFTHNHRLVCELKYAQERYNIKGSETPDKEFAKQLQYYINLLQLTQDREGRVPDQIDDMFHERYGFGFN